MLKHKKFIRIISAVLTLIFICTAFIGCKARALYPTSSATRSVGTVGDYQVPYEELYMLATLYDSDELSGEQLWAQISENITANYATLELCRQAGVEYDEKELEENIELEVESYIENSFDGSRSNYLKSLKQNGLTDHYLRFTIKTDLLYNTALIPALVRSGDILTAEDDVVAYARENLVLTLHIMLADNDGVSAEENLATATSLLSDLQSGRKSMYELIGSKYNNDVLIPPDGGYLIARGTGNPDYEEAAFALEYGECALVSTNATLANGEYTSCHYIIQRLEITDEYVEEHYTDMYDEYQYSVADAMREKIKATLTFVPNEYASTLDIKSLKAPSAGIDLTLIIWVSVICLVVAAVTVTTVIVYRKRRAAFLKDKQSRALANKK